VALRIDLESCSGCGSCEESCPFAAIELVDDRPVVGDGCTLCGACVDVCPEGAISIDAQEAPAAPADASGVWVFAERRADGLHPVGLELLGRGRGLADDLGVKLTAILLGHDGDLTADAAELIAFGADEVLVARDPALAEFSDDAYGQVVSRLIAERKPEIVLCGATAIGRSFFPRVAVAVGAGLTADCTDLAIDPERRLLLQTRPAFGGNIMATIISPQRRPQMATGRAGEVIEVGALDGLEVRTRLVEVVREVTDRVDLGSAEVIVTGGRGLGEADGFGLIRKLAEALGGVVGATRGAVDNGWIDYAHQVGQTGKTVAPKLYVACGVSGAVQHLVGMQSSDVIVAVNTDAQAPIFSVATYGLVGDLYQIVPAMLQELGAA
jgi:electron transfer flavoprotein alpha subunit